MVFFERLVDGRKYRVAADSVWDPRTKQPVSRQVLLGPADPAPGHQGRRPTVMISPELSPVQRKAVKTFELARWMPTLSSTM